MSLEFFWASGSCNSWRVHLALELKQVPYQPRLLQISQKEHKAAEYLAINPRGKVPAIREGSFTLSESVAILLYLDRKVPEPALFGKTAEEAGQVLRRTLELIHYLEPPLDRMAMPIYRGQVEPEVVKAAAREVHRELALLEAALTEAPFLVGPSISAADLTAFPFVQQVLRASGKEVASSLELGFLPLDRTYPATAAWVKRIEALPGYQRTYPPHWR
jgi:glutathione S-transferase